MKQVPKEKKNPYNLQEIDERPLWQQHREETLNDLDAYSNHINS